MGKKHLSLEEQLSGGATLVENLLGTHIVSSGSGEDDVEHFCAPKPACAPLWSTIVLHRRFHLLIKLAINNTVFLVQLRAERVVTWELTHVSWEHRVIWVNLSLPHA